MSDWFGDPFGGIVNYVTLYGGFIFLFIILIIILIVVAYSMMR
jgi:hypothetical protein